MHKLPVGLKKVLVKDKILEEKWESLTPLARNEWICWVTFPKKHETRKEHVIRFSSEIKAGKRRPCCWLGCIHRKEKAASPSVRGILKKRVIRRS